MKGLITLVVSSRNHAVAEVRRGDTTGLNMPLYRLTLPSSRRSAVYSGFATSRTATGTSRIVGVTFSGRPSSSLNDPIAVAAAPRLAIARACVAADSTTTPLLDTDSAAPVAGFFTG